jgi:hypothetical protein
MAIFASFAPQFSVAAGLWVKPLMGLRKTARGRARHLTDGRAREISFFTVSYNVRYRRCASSLVIAAYAKYASFLEMEPVGAP